MKTERAIELLNRISDSQFDGIHGDERREALEMAVRALEQNLVKESGDLVKDLVKDCISRKATMIVIENSGLDDDSKDTVVRVLEQLPSAQPERKKGKWITDIKHHEDEGQNFYYEETRCSVCGVRKRIGWYDANYCPNCGADMRGESE